MLRYNTGACVARCEIVNSLVALRSLGSLEFLILMSENRLTLNVRNWLPKNQLRWDYLALSLRCHGLKRDTLRDFNVPTQDALQLASYIAVVRAVLVVETFQMIEYVLDFRDTFSDYPEFLFWIGKTIGLDILDFVHCVLLLLSPLKLLVEEVKDHEVETPKVISSRKVLLWSVQETLPRYCERSKKRMRPCL